MVDADRELLELAAKAAGLLDQLVWVTKVDVGVFDPMFMELKPELHYLRFRALPDTRWNPLTDDGDALRLAVNLNLSVILTGFGAQVSEIEGRSSIEPYSTDPLAATRRAIVRAAAEIGRAKAPMFNGMTEIETNKTASVSGLVAVCTPKKGD